MAADNNSSTSNWTFGKGPVHGNDCLDTKVFAERSAPTPIDPSATERFYSEELEERIAALKSEGKDASTFEEALAGIRRSQH